MSLNLHNEIWLSLITILDPALDGWELRWFCWLQGFNVAFQNLMWFGLPSINWKTPEVLQLFLKDNTFKIALVGWRKVIKARREALNNSIWGFKFERCHEHRSFTPDLLLKVPKPRSLVSSSSHDQRTTLKSLQYFDSAAFAVEFLETLLLVSDTPALEVSS